MTEVFHKAASNALKLVKWRCPECKTTWMLVRPPKGYLPPYLCGPCGARGRGRRLVLAR